MMPVSGAGSLVQATVITPEALCARSGTKLAAGESKWSRYFLLPRWIMARY